MTGGLAGAWSGPRQGPTTLCAASLPSFCIPLVSGGTRKEESRELEKSPAQLHSKESLIYFYILLVFMFLFPQGRPLHCTQHTPILKMAALIIGLNFLDFIHVSSTLKKAKHLQFSVLSE